MHVAGPAGRAKAPWRGIIKTTLALALLHAVGKLVLAARDIGIGQTFGTSDVIDAFIFASVIPNIVVGTLVGAIGQALVPVFIEIERKQGADAARRLAASALAATIVFLLIVVTGLAFGAPAMVHAMSGSFAPEKAALAGLLMQALLPFVVLRGIATFWGALINARGRFSLVALSAMATPLLNIVVLAIFGNQAGAWPLVAATVGGAAVEVALLVPILRRLDLPVRPGWGGTDGAARRVFWQYVPFAIGAAAMSANALVDQVMAAGLAVGGVAAINYGGKIVTLAFEMAVAPLSTVLLPALSRQVANGEWRHLAAACRFWAAVGAGVALPLTAVGWFWAEDIVRLVFERGAFTAHDTAMVAPLFAVYVLQLPFNVVGTIGARVLNALQMAPALALVGGMNFATNIVLNVILGRIYGLPGIAMATTLMYVIAAAVIWTLVVRRIAHLRAGEP